MPDGKQRQVPKKYLSFTDTDYLAGLNPQKAERVTKNLLVANQKTVERWQKEVIAGIQRANKGFLKALKNNYSFIVDVDKVIKALDYDKPSLIITGRQDTIVGYRDQWKLLEIFPRASFAVLDATDHSLQIEAPKIFTALVENWLKRLKNLA
ncbi:alpha/beta fold hydrolase [Lactobacillus sp. PV034]|uniref:alpha/beta fold hydrolase n=1 Tax=Lactobacillus sp. PV034 TaxID=2594495 RepID=UPI00223EC281|nr:alpha/beta hydrolase [Lactobacillus sp. PV034]